MLATTGSPSTEVSCHSKSRRSLMRLAARNGSIAAENAIIENWGANKKASRKGSPVVLAKAVAVRRRCPIVHT